MFRVFHETTKISMPKGLYHCKFTFFLNIERFYFQFFANYYKHVTQFQLKFNFEPKNVPDRLVAR